MNRSQEFIIFPPLSLHHFVVAKPPLEATPPFKVPERRVKYPLRRNDYQNEKKTHTFFYVIAPGPLQGFPVEPLKIIRISFFLPVIILKRRATYFDQTFARAIQAQTPLCQIVCTTEMATTLWLLEARQPTINRKHPDRSRAFSHVFHLSLRFYFLLVFALFDLSATKIASQNRSDNGGRKRACNHSAAEIAGFFALPAAKKSLATSDFGG